MADLKRKAVESNASTRDVLDSTDNLRDEEIAKMGCKPSSLARIVGKARAAGRDYPSSPTSIEDLSIPSSLPSHIYCGEPLLLWDSGYSTARANIAALQEADHLVIDGTFKSAPFLFTQMLGVHRQFDENWHFPLTFGLLPGKSQVLYIV